MPSSAELAYTQLPADSRAEIRLPAVLKEHALRVAQARGETLTELVIEALAAIVAQEMPAIEEWNLTPDEQIRLLQTLGRQSELTARSERARADADRLFGPAVNAARSDGADQRPFVPVKGGR